MPHVILKTNIEIVKEDEIRLKEQLGALIAFIEGKSEQWLMAEFVPSSKLWFQGSDEACAMVSVYIYGDHSSYDNFTEHMTQRIQEILSIKKDRIYIKYYETPYWGWNGRNF